MTTFARRLHLQIKLIGNEVKGVELMPCDENQSKLPPMASSTMTFFDNMIWLIGGLFENGHFSNKLFKIELVDDQKYKIVEERTLHQALHLPFLL